MILVSIEVQKAYPAGVPLAEAKKTEITQEGKKFTLCGKGPFTLQSKDR